MLADESAITSLPCLPSSFYQQEDVVEVARGLLGKILWVEGADGLPSAVLITETEAYKGAEDRACHAYGYRRTPRTETMFRAGGVAYVYLCYGIHHLLNVVTHREGEPHAVLVRAGQPVAGLPNMLARRQMRQLHPRLTSGPGALSGALGIQVATHNGLAIGSNSIRIFDPGTYVPPPEVRVGTRVGVGYAGTDALRPYRFRVANCPFVSKAKGVGE